MGHNSSGDLFIAFATGNHVPAESDGTIPLTGMIPNNHLNPFFDAVVEAVEESILNALAAAETMTGAGGHIAHALPLDELKLVMAKYRPA
jgi:D-aminopeptidase